MASNIERIKKLLARFEIDEESMLANLPQALQEGGQTRRLKADVIRKLIRFLLQTDAVILLGGQFVVGISRLKKNAKVVKIIEILNKYPIIILKDKKTKREFKTLQEYYQFKFDEKARKMLEKMENIKKKEEERKAKGQAEELLKAKTKVKQIENTQREEQLEEDSQLLVQELDEVRQELTKEVGDGGPDAGELGDEEKDLIKKADDIQTKLDETLKGVEKPDNFEKLDERERTLAVQDVNEPVIARASNERTIEGQDRSDKEQEKQLKQNVDIKAEKIIPTPAGVDQSFSNEPDEKSDGVEFDFLQSVASQTADVVQHSQGPLAGHIRLNDLLNLFNQTPSSEEDKRMGFAVQIFELRNIVDLQKSADKSREMNQIINNILRKLGPATDIATLLNWLEVQQDSGILDSVEEAVNEAKRDLESFYIELEQFKTRVAVDGLTSSELDEASTLTGTRSESAHTKIFKNVINDIISRIDNNGGIISEEILKRINILFSFVSQQTLDIVKDILFNDPNQLFELSIGRTFVEPILIRLVARLVYEGVILLTKVKEINVQSFIQFGRTPMPKVDLGRRRINQLLGTTEEDEPPEIVIEAVAPAVQEQTLRRRRARREHTDIFGDFTKKVNEDVAKGETQPGRFQGFLNSISNFGRNLLSEERKEFEAFNAQLDDLEGQEAVPTEEQERLAELLKSALGERLPPEADEEKQAELLNNLESGSIFAAAFATTQTSGGVGDIIGNYVNQIGHFLNQNVNANVLRNALGGIGNIAEYLRQNALRAVVPLFAQIPGFNRLPDGTLQNILLSALMLGVFASITNITPIEIDEFDEDIQKITQEAKRPVSTEFLKGVEKQVPVEDIDKPIGRPLLRPEFNMVGIDFFNEKFAMTPIDVENNEWASFNFVSEFDRLNKIEIDNIISDDLIHYNLNILPKYVKPPEPPTLQTEILMRNKMTPQIQINQPFAEKFTPAISSHSNLSYILENRMIDNPFDRNILYNQYIPII